MAQTITILVNKHGTDVQVETAGFVGGSCRNATEKLEKLIGLKEVNEQLKPEFYADVNQLLNEVAQDG